MDTQKSYCGIDVSADVLDVCYVDSLGKYYHFQGTNNRAILKTCPPESRFVMESTGVYHLGLMFFLEENNRLYSVVNGLQIRRYIQMHLERNKTDKKDAKRICEYGIEREPVLTKKPDNKYFESHSLNNSIHYLTKEITRFKNQIHSLERAPFDTSGIVKSYKSIIKKMESEKMKLESELDAVLQEW